MTSLLLIPLSLWLSATAPPIPVPVNDGVWTLSTSGKFEAWIDRRELLVLYHPWEESASGMAAGAECTVALPAEWKGPARLHFYMTDDYDGQAPLFEGDWRGRIALPGHRFKQVWVNDALIWEQDVADAEGTAQPSHFAVPLPASIASGQSFRLAFKLADKTGSGERLPGDLRTIAPIDGIAESDPWRFMTHLYVGDVTITPASMETTEPQPSPLARAVREKAFARRPVFPASDAAVLPVRLQVKGGASEGFPRALRCGVPLPRGLFHSSEIGQLQLTTIDNQPIPCRASPMNLWDDGSVRWAEIHAALDGAATEVVLSRDPALAQPVPNPSPAAVDENEWPVLGPVLTRMPWNGQPPLELSAHIEAEGKSFVPKRASATRTSGPILRETQLSGILDSDSGALGRYTCAISTIEGLPYARVLWRVFADRPGQAKISRMHLDLSVPFSNAAQVCWKKEGPMRSGEIHLRQTATDESQVCGADGAAIEEVSQGAGWIGVTDGQHSVCVQLRHFAEQHPVELTFREGHIEIGTFSRTPESPEYLPHEGEAKRHEIWIGWWERALTSEEFARVAAAFADPPHLMNPDYFCATGAMGRGYPHDDTRFAELTAFMKKTYGVMPESSFNATGIRDWGDLLYNKEKQQWRNGYYDTPQGFAAEYLMTGDEHWFRRLEASARHIADVDICYASKEHPEWIGGIHGYDGADHSTAAPWPPTQRIKGLLAYARIAADRDIREAALGVADSAIRANRAIGASSVRDHAGVLDALVAAYDETRDAKYLEGARRLAHDAMTKIDSRRGCYAEIHGNVSYRGNVPWMVAQLAEPMFEYCEQSGDIEAATAMAGLAESILTENCTRGVLGDVYGYSHNPHFKKNSSYHILIAPTLGYAWDLSGDSEFSRHAQAMYAQTLREDSVNPINNCYWDTPTLLYYLDAWNR